MTHGRMNKVFTRNQPKILPDFAHSSHYELPLYLETVNMSLSTELSWQGTHPIKTPTACALLI